MSARASAMAAVIVLLLGGLGNVPAASANTPGCVTRAEYERVHEGMKRARVHAIFDTRGVAADWGRAYPICKRFRGYPHKRWVFVDYEQRRVVAKEWAITGW